MSVMCQFGVHMLISPATSVQYNCGLIYTVNRVESETNGGFSLWLLPLKLEDVWVALVTPGEDGIST